MFENINHVITKILNDVFIYLNIQISFSLVAPTSKMALWFCVTTVRGNFREKWRCFSKSPSSFNSFFFVYLGSVVQLFIALFILLRLNSQINPGLETDCIDDFFIETLFITTLHLVI